MLYFIQSQFKQKKIYWSVFNSNGGTTSEATGEISLSATDTTLHTFTLYVTRQSTFTISCVTKNTAGAMNIYAILLSFAQLTKFKICCFIIYLLQNIFYLFW